MSIEPMADFFTARVEGYDAHMLENVEGCAEGYVELARRLPESLTRLLDLGCGTGLELHEIFKRFPDARVMGVDLTQAMLDKLSAKYPDKAIELICGSYLDRDFGSHQFEAAISFETMHHLTHAQKLDLYTRIRQALKPGGQYIECDYMVLDQAEEDFFFADNQRIRREMGIPEGEFYHYDTPCTVENQLMLLRRAGFSAVESVWRQGSTTIIVASV